MKECLAYKKIDAQRLQCQTCNHFCVIKEGTVGICGVRQNLGGKLCLLTYGKAAALHVDPVEKKPLFHFLPGSMSYSLGTIGCNFRCKNCQNYDISQMYGAKGQVAKYDSLNWGYSVSPQRIVDEAVAHRCQSIAYTYNEPTVFMEYALDTMKLAAEKGLKNIWVSNGFMSEQTLDLVVPYLDAINVDIKSFDDEFYQKNCGARLEPVLDNCRRLLKTGVWTEVTTLLIPSLSDDEEMLRKVAKFIKIELGEFVPWHVSAFSAAISWKLKHLSDTSFAQIKRAYEIGKEEGLKYVYGGNIWEEDFESTYCPQCKEKVIRRNAYEVFRQDKNGQCQKCGFMLEGVF